MGRSKASQRLRQTDQDAGDEGPLDTAETAQGDDGKGDRPEQTAHLGINIMYVERKAPATPTRAAPIPKRGVDPFCIDPHEARPIPGSFLSPGLLSCLRLFHEQK